MKVLFFVALGLLLLVKVHKCLPAGEKPGPRNGSPKDVYIDVVQLLKEAKEQEPPSKLSDAPAVDETPRKHRHHGKVPNTLLKEGATTNQNENLKGQAHKGKKGNGKGKNGDMKHVKVDIKQSKLVKKEVGTPYYPEYQAQQPQMLSAIPVNYNSRPLESNVQYYPSQYMNGNPVSSPYNSPSYIQTIPFTSVEPPTLSWTAIIEYPGRDPIYISDTNYTENADVEVIVHPASEQPGVIPLITDDVPTPPEGEKIPGIPQAHVSTEAEYAPETGIPPIIWNNGVPYVPYEKPTVFYQPPSPGPIRSSQPIQQWYPSYYNPVATPYYTQPIYPPQPYFAPVPVYAPQTYYPPNPYYQPQPWGGYQPPSVSVGYDYSGSQHTPQTAPVSSGNELVDVHHYPYTGTDAVPLPIPVDKPGTKPNVHEPLKGAEDDTDDDDYKDEDDDEDEDEEDDSKRK